MSIASKIPKVVNPKYKIALIGATGAVGKEIVRTAMDEKYGEKIKEFTVIVREKLDEWKRLEE